MPIKSVMEIQDYKIPRLGFKEPPTAASDIDYILYQSKNIKKYMVITEKKKALAAEIRIGKYDKLVKVNLGLYEDTIHKTVFCEEGTHEFYVDIRVGCKITDSEYVFCKNINDVLAVIRQSFDDLEYIFNNKYDFRDKSRFSQELKGYIDDKLNALTFLRVEYSYAIKLDAAAEKIIEREKQHEFIVTDKDLTAAEDNIEITNSYDLKDIEAQRQKELERKKTEILEQKAAFIGQMRALYGDNAGNIISYAEGDLKAKDLSDILRNEKIENIQMTFDIMMKLHNEGVLSDEVLEKFVPSLLNSGDNLLNMNSREGLEVKKTKPEKVSGKQTSGFVWNDNSQEDEEIE